MKTYTTYQNDIPRIINNSLADNITWSNEVINESLRYLTTKYYFNERSYTTNTIAQTQFYNLPPQVKKLINVYITVGNVRWVLKEVPSRGKWDEMNVVTFYQDFPSNFFIFNGQVGIFPIPASSGNVITMNYKVRTIDMSMADVTNTSVSNSISIQGGTTTLLAGAGTTTFYNWMANNWVRIPYNATNNAASGDNQWYQIQSVANGTTAYLMAPYSGSTVVNGNFTIGEAPILPEDYQDLPLYRLGIVYYTTRFPDQSKAQWYQSLWDKGIAQLDEEFGSKSTSIELDSPGQPQINPNLYIRSMG